MKDREETIQFEMNYCQNYDTKRGNITCTAGMDMSAIKRHPTGEKGYLWGPCIGGHELSNATEICPQWVRRTREQGEDRADRVEKFFTQMELVGPVVAEWRKQKPIGKAEIIECPACKGKLHLSQASCNGHVHGKCETAGCVSWME